jgi:ADP-heptose:LPS heptosyltransferase
VKIRRKQYIDKYLGYALIALFLPFTRLLGILMFRNHSTAKEPRRLLFIKLMGIGSLIVASDAISAMRKRFPDTRFILLTDTNVANAIRPFDLFDEIQVADTDNLMSTAFTMARFFTRAWTWRRLWVVDLEVYSKLTTVLALLTLARNRFGFFLPPVPFRKYLNTHNIPFDQSAFLGHNYETMAMTLTGETRLEIPEAPRRPDEVHKPFIILNNTCSGLAAVRRLPDPTFAAVCGWVLRNTHYRLALLGSPGDRPAIEQFIGDDPQLNAQKQRILNFAGVTDSFEEYYAFLKNHGALLVSIDSGPLHMARKLGLPTLSIWGPTNPANYLDIPAGERHRHQFYYSKAPCSPCVHRHEQLPCGGNNVCMQMIPAAEIGEMIGKMLDGLLSNREYELSQGIKPDSSVLI